MATSWLFSARQKYRTLAARSYQLIVRPLSMTEPLSFHAQRWIKTSRGWVAAIRAFTELSEDERKEWVGKPIRIDMEEYEVLGVERFAVDFWHRLEFGIL